MTDEQYKKLNQLSEKIEALKEDDLLFSNTYRDIQEYFNFIRSNPELNPIAETIINSDLMLKASLKSFYHNQYHIGSTPDITFIRRLNSKLFMALGNAQKIVNLSSKKIKINILIKRNRSVIYRDKDTEQEKSYTPKDEYPNWLKIIDTLHKNKTPMTAKAIAIDLGKDGHNKTIQDHIKKQIKYINKIIGKEKLNLYEGLVNINQTTSRNLYKLNEEKYFFIFEHL